jgi:acyl-coenzyme A thioesterase 13
VRAPDGSERVVLTNVGSRARTIGVTVAGGSGNGSLSLLSGKSLKASGGTRLGGRSLSSRTGELTGKPRLTLVRPNAHGVHGFQHTPGWCCDFPIEPAQDAIPFVTGQTGYDGSVDAPDGFIPFENPGPFLEQLGPIYVATGAEELILGMYLEERHTNHRGTVQGGVLSTLADFALGRAIEADADDGQDRATVSLTVDFLKPTNPGDWIESRTRVERVGSTLSFADCALLVQEREVVRARAVWVTA